uniref:Uncharacterized protein n=1 Tax=Calcidiscus leptoporus TaxID=127549 RepID=A0A7S0NUU8_9EUKA
MRINVVIIGSREGYFGVARDYDLDLFGARTWNVAVLVPDEGTVERVSAADVLGGFDMHQCAMEMCVSDSLDVGFRCTPEARACALRGEMSFTASAFCSDEKNRENAIMKVLAREHKYRQRGFSLVPAAAPAASAEARLAWPSGSSGVQRRRCT